jgi:hypothetical protein
MVKRAAREVQKKAKWKDHETIQNLKFSNHYIHKLLNRYGLRRRRCTRKHQPQVSFQKAKEIMRKHQETYMSKQFSPETSINLDETGFTYAIGSDYLYLPTDGKRGEYAQGHNEKLRVTCEIAVNGEGDFLPLFVLIKHSRKADNETSMRVVKSLHKQEGYRDEEGWELKEWNKEIETEDKKGTKAKHYHRCNYLINRESGHVISSQHKAWMDTIKFSMYTDLILEPYKEDKKKLLTWMDNCRSHTTDHISDQFNQKSIVSAFYPANMTSILQVLDLVVNGPIKTKTKSNRNQQIFEEFQDYLQKIDDLSSSSEDEETSLTPPPFELSPPTLSSAILDLIKTVEEDFSTEKFKKGIKETFYKTGMIPDEKGNFVDMNEIFNEYNRGTLKTEGTSIQGITFDADEDEDNINEEDLEEDEEDEEEE